MMSFFSGRQKRGKKKKGKGHGRVLPSPTSFLFQLDRPWTGEKGGEGGGERKEGRSAYFPPRPKTEKEKKKEGEGRRPLHAIPLSIFLLLQRRPGKRKGEKEEEGDGRAGKDQTVSFPYFPDADFGPLNNANQMRG